MFFVLIHNAPSDSTESKSNTGFYNRMEIDRNFHFQMKNQEKEESSPSYREKKFKMHSREEKHPSRSDSGDLHCTFITYQVSCFFTREIRREKCHAKNGVKLSGADRCVNGRWHRRRR